MSLRAVRQRVEGACARSGRDPSDVTLVVVTKGRTPSQILDVYSAGHRDFGENRAQEFESKAENLPEDIRWHFIGPLQTNKVKLVRPVVSLLHSMDRGRLGRAWLREPGVSPPALLQVNVGGEVQKHGAPLDDAEALWEELADLGVDLRGLMTIPPIGPERARGYFTELRQLRDRLEARWPACRELSMGMTDDFEVAVEEGATYIRVGRAIFDA